MKNKRKARISALLFAFLSIVIIAIAQLIRTANGEATGPVFLLAYAPAFAMILAAAFRSYLLYFLGVAFYTLHQFLNLLFRSLREGSYSGYELFDTVVEYILLVLAGCLLWQLILFTFGHADIVALTHTSMLFVTLTLLLTFLPFMIRVFRVDLYVTDAYHVVCLGLSYLSFCTGMEKSAPASGPAAQGTYADPGTTDPTGSAPGASAPVPRPQKDIPPASGEDRPADPGCHTEE